MLEIEIPGRRPLQLEHLVLDLNGTLALDGELLPGVEERLSRLAEALSIHVLTADTFGTAAGLFTGLPVSLEKVPEHDQAEAKAVYVQKLGPGRTVAVGNGANDGLMLGRAALGMAVIGPEGCAGAALRAAHLVVPGIEAALDLLLHPRRLQATLRT